MIFKSCEIVNVAPLYFKGSPMPYIYINCVHECDLLGITLSSNITTHNVMEKAVMKFNITSNEVFSYFKLLPCYIKSFCIDAYGCEV